MSSPKYVRLNIAGGDSSITERPVFEQFEPRLLFSGDLVAVDDAFATSEDSPVIISPLDNDSIQIGGQNGSGSFTQNGITFSWSGSPTTGLAGYSTWTVTAAAAQGVLLGFDVEFTADEIHHEAPFGLSAIWNDSVSQAAYDADPDVEKYRDSYFLFNTSDFLSVRQTESDTSLSATFAFTNDQLKQASLDIARIVLPSGETFSLTGNVVTQVGAGPLVEVGVSGLLALTGEADIDSFSDPAHGTVVDNGDGTLTYTPDAGYFGSDSFTYTITDGQGETDTATVTMTVTSTNQAPAAVDDVAETDEDSPVVISPLANDTDPDEDSLDIDSFSDPAHGTVVDNGDGTLTYTPDAGYFGSDSFTYTITDGQGETDTATVALTVIEDESVDYSLSFGAGQKVTFIDSSGDVVKVKLSGPGVGTIWLSNQGSGDVSKLSVTGTTSRSTLRIAVKKTRYGQNTTSIGELEVDGSLRSIVASQASLSGDMTISGKLGVLKLGQVHSGSEIQLNTSSIALSSRDKVKIFLGRVQGARIDTHGLAILSLSAIEWLDGGSSQIVAPWIGRLAIKGQRANSKKGLTWLAGNFGADLILSGVGAGRATLGRAKIAGNLTSQLWDVFGNIGNVRVVQAVRGTNAQRVMVRSTGNMGSLVFGSVEKADFLAGIARNGKTNADSASDFVNPEASIKSVRIKGIRGSSSRFFIDSTFSAASFKTINLLNLDASNPGGIFALDTEGGTEIRSIRHKDSVTRQKWSWSTRSQLAMPGPAGFVELL